MSLTLYHAIESAVVLGVVATALFVFVRRLLPRRTGGSAGCGGCSGCGSSSGGGGGGGGCGTSSAASEAAAPREQVIAMPEPRRRDGTGTP